MAKNEIAELQKKLKQSGHTIDSLNETINTQENLLILL